MDVSTLDPLSAQLAIELEIEDMDANINAILPDLDQAQRDMVEKQHYSFREKLVNQLGLLRIQVEFGLSIEDTQIMIDDELIARLRDSSIDKGGKSGVGGGSVDFAKDGPITSKHDDALALTDGRRPAVPTQPADPAPSSTSLRKEEEHLCSVCLDSFPAKNTTTLDCEPERHTYCHTCLAHLFETAVFKETSLFPPRCCQKDIPLDIGRELLSKDLIKDFDLKVEELKSPNPTFCSNRECAKFIRASEIQHNIGTCPFCKDKTCSTCKGKAHEEQLCPQDPDTISLQDEAKRSKWQQCSECKNMVELSAGCFHITCRCRHHFCYLCGAKWKTCECVTLAEEYVVIPDAA
ncbi:hypothetical protein P280DRAFT_319736 [Massarina eburnea CBS 473.64]|uniref:RBR-type E3 ubiquitin transferase n=1 Tax=Massarina eburnea CBS 473.64 TaxID=1395130 RepID=A0A6A6RY22_9PLEO|nr:hypothetical protein P280DRAFT_319736 [Massarina eburnea CBS 473.64]